MEGCPESLEMIFQKLEEESEQRAEEHLNTKTPGLEVNGEPIENSGLSISAKKVRERRRGSVSISRIGQLPISEEDVVSSNSIPSSPTLLNIASKSPFYQSQIANDSTTSIASGASAFSNDHAHTEDDSHVTQMQHIVGKASISAKMFPRRLSRSQSAGVIPTMGTISTDPPVIIDVIVQEATVKSSPEPDDMEGGMVTKSRRANVSVHASGTLRHQSSRSTIPRVTLSNTSSWFAKAKSFTQKFKRKRKSSISGLLSYS
ncbi:hypothetical protein GALMADRAFT_1143285 [Galerina marginata CBS 339.88]|uniref:Uncharacterized protein n=1 Tax=Galerina marginata (strain CBS 339.88) TaxID=685588 RepID=A0A067SIF1_GALM3|nr:hypothetical protein GALMADRAFT_1143285 [Galerina marginata CBS 339.88]